MRCAILSTQHPKQVRNSKWFEMECGLPITVQLFQCRTIVSLQEFLENLKLGQDQCSVDPATVNPANQPAPAGPCGCQPGGMEASPAQKTVTNPEIPVEDCCRFCRKNGEASAVYSSHTTYDATNRRIVTCPILRRLVCPLCGASGDSAHTLFYCPRNGDRGPRPVMATLKGRRTACGIKRFNPAR